MSVSTSRSVLIALDSNVLLDLAEEVEDVVDALMVIRRRLRQAELLMPPTVREELAEEALNSDSLELRERAIEAFACAWAWKIRMADLVGDQSELATRIGRRLRGLGLLPEEEINDGIIAAEAALLGCSILLTSDEHLRGMDFTQLAFELQRSGAAVPVMATPREVVRKFFR
jgi:predicted nucleic acid-binding protein